MKLKRTLALGLSCVLLTAVLAGCGGTQTPSATPAAPAAETPAAPAAETPAAPAVEAPASGVSEITLYNNKVEIDDALKKYAATYEAQTGVKVNIRSAGGDTAYDVALKADIQGGQEPDIFVFEGPSGYELYKDRFIDLSDQPWVADTDLAYKVDGKVFGFPVAIEGYGLAYNKDILDACGVDPAKLTNVNALKEAFAAIDAKKAELGLTGAISLPAGPGMTWVTGLHNINVYLTVGLAYDDTSIIDQMLQGKVDEARFKEYTDYVALLFKNADQNVLLSGDYDAQINAFLDGKTAFLHQGNWADPNLANASFTMGYAPHPFMTKDTDGILAAPPSWYGVNGKAAGVEEAKKFLTAMASTPEGHDYMVNIAGMIPAFKSVTLKPAGQLSKSVMEWSSAGKLYSWQQYKMPDGFGMNILGPIYQLLADGTLDADSFNAQMKAEIANIR